jgi:hypothetical protein
MTMSSIGNIFGIMQSANLQYDPYYFLERYVPYINWEEFKTKAEEYQRKIDVKTAVEAGETANAMGGQQQMMQA